ncbi:SWI/SNF chromatin-remodeling complex subunit sol1 [Rhypophila decipiens]
MSSSWINEAAVQNHNGNGFPHINDPSAVAGAMMDPSAFMANSAPFNPQFANPQQIVMPNGPMRNASPSFPNPMYQTNQVIPSKRPRPREDSMGQSPRQAPGMLPTSRAETPQQSQFAGFQQPGMPQPQAGQPSQYPHLQPNGSANATPSPIMGNQMRPGSVPQRVSTASPHPHPFSPAAQQFSQQSPIPSEHGGTPQPFMQQNNFGPGFNPQFTPSQSPSRPSASPNPMTGQMMPQQMGQISQQMPQMPGQMPGQMPSQMAGQMQNQMFQQQLAQGRNPMEQQQHQQRMMYQMQLQQQAQRNNMQMPQMPGQNMMPQGMQPGQQPPQGQPRPMMAPRPGMPNGQMAPGAMRPQPGGPQQPGMPRPQPPEQFMKNLTTFMHSKNLPLDLNPIVEGRPIPLMSLFQVVFHKYGGYRNVTQSNLWPQLSSMLGFPPQHAPTAPQHLRAIYERNLAKFEEAWANQHKMRMQQQGGAHVAPQLQQGTPTKGMHPGQMGPNQMMQPGQQQQFQQGPIPSPIKPPGPQQSVNGFPSPHPSQVQQPGHAPPGHNRNNMSRSVQPTPTADEFPLSSPAHSKAGSISMPGSAHPEGQRLHEDSATALRFPAPFTRDPEEYIPCSRELTRYGGVDLQAVDKYGPDLIKFRPDIPPAEELGNVDIHALTKSIQSGIHGEVRLALDTLATISVIGPEDPKYARLRLDLRLCDDLVESLVECAEEQVDLLAEHSEEASNEVTLSSYEDVVRACRIERFGIRSVSLFGSQGYELDHAADRLIAITTILRNLSFPEENQASLADDTVIKFLCVVIRYLGTREMLLRTHVNTLDFMKDIVIFLSNVAGSIEIPGREQAFCLLQFLLAFAPSPAPTFTNDQLFFSPYDPALHPYLPHAVDSLAKLLARDEPNRSHYKTIFSAELNAPSTPPCELLTRTFALAISPIPDNSRQTKRQPNFPPLVEIRKPFLMQGLLAADILAALAPSFETGVTRSWLASGNGFAQNLFVLIRQLSTQYDSQAMRPGGGRGQNRRDSELVYIVGLAVNTLRRLCEKAREPSDPVGEHSIPPNALPRNDGLLAALQMHAPEWSKEGMLADLMAYANLER